MNARSVGKPTTGRHKQRGKPEPEQVSTPATGQPPPTETLGRPVSQLSYPGLDPVTGSGSNRIGPLKTVPPPDLPADTPSDLAKADRKRSVRLAIVGAVGVVVVVFATFGLTQRTQLAGQVDAGCAKVREQGKQPAIFAESCQTAADVKGQAVPIVPAQVPAPATVTRTAAAPPPVTVTNVAPAPPEATTTETERTTVTQVPPPETVVRTTTVTAPPPPTTDPSPPPTDEDGPPLLGN